MNIVLIGMRATGKTTVGQILANTLKREFIETDELVAKKSGYSIAEIVEKHGWEYFRDLESQVIQKISTMNNAVISTGGGVVTRKKNIESLKTNGLLILLTATVDTMEKRLNGTRRPALTSKQTIRQEIEEILKKRKTLYGNASQERISTDDQNPQEVVVKIINLSSQTVVCGIIGNPVAHSLSPVMHNAGYKVKNLNYAYVPFEVKDLANAIRGIRALNIKGTSVTAPFKIAIMQYLDKIDDVAMNIGAVNTIVNNNGKLIGFNTDCEGAMKALEEKTTVSGKRVILLGAGGAAAAIAFGLKEKKADVLIINRTIQKAKELARTTNARFDGLSGLKYIEKSDILINATSVQIIPKEFLHKKLFVFDIVYNPKETLLIRDAKQAGCSIVYGYKMLLYQAVAQFELFTGTSAPVSIMEKALLKALKR